MLDHLFIEIESGKIILFGLFVIADAFIGGSYRKIEIK